jgi:two-component system, cell cycle sensor histidine kinase and response regulator CckA
MAAENQGETHSAAGPGPVIDREIRQGATSGLLALGAALIAVAAVFVFFRDKLGETFLLGVLGIFAMVGIFYLFASVIGFIRIAPRSSGSELSKAFVDGSAEGTVICDAKGRIVYANHAYAKLTGAQGSTDVRSIESILSGDADAPEVIYRLSQKLRDGVGGIEEFRLSKPLGAASGEQSRWYRLRARALALADQKEPLSAWQISDISSERAEQEKFFRDLQDAIDHLDHAPAGFFSADAKGAITYINSTLAEWLGIDLVQFQSGTVDVADIVAGDGMALIDSVRAEPGAVKTAVIDLDLAKRNGQALPVRFYQRVQASKDGTTGSIRTIVLNRSDGASPPSDAAASEMRFTRFFNSAPMAIAAVDRAGRVLRTNARFLKTFAGIVDRQAVDLHVKLDTLIHERDRALFSQKLDLAMAGQADIAPLESVLPSDEARHLRVYFNAVADGAEEAADEAAFVYAVETTEQKALEAQMAQSQKMQAVGQLAGGIAHDFNNVLTAVIMSSDLLLSNHNSASDPSFQDIMNIKQNANRAAALVRQLLAFSRKQTLRPEVLSLTDVLADLRMLLTRLAGHNVKLKLDHGRDLWPIRADVGQLEQVIVNLIVNARDAMPDRGEISVRSRNLPQAECAGLTYRELVPADYVLIEVEDNGSGIPADIREKIFEPFFTTKEVGKGTGLGLSMVYGIVKQTGGFIYLESEEGKGTIFRIFLPRHTPSASAAASDAAAEARSVQKAPENGSSSAARDLSGSAIVLLVEDEDSVRMGGVRALQSRGYTVHEAASGVEALEVLEALGGKVDIIVSDVVMPEMDGPTLLRELRKKYTDIKFIFVSGYAEDAFAKNLPEDAKFGFLPKPFSLKQLASAVKDMLDGKMEQ